MRVLRWIGAVLVIAMLLAIADGTLLRWWNMPSRMVIHAPLPFKPYSEEVLNIMKAARAASRADDHKRAVDLYTQALALEPGPNTATRDLLALRGSEYNYLNKSEQAFADYDAAIRMGFYGRPTTDGALRAFMGRGYASVNLAQYARAKQDFDAVLKELPNDVPRSSATLAWRGAAYQGLGDRAHAIADYKAALALDPHNSYAKDALKDMAAP